MIDITVLQNSVIYDIIHLKAEEQSDNLHCLFRNAAVMQVTARKNKYRQTFTSTVIQQCKSEALPKADNRHTVAT